MKGAELNVRGWYEADALTADLAVHCHTMMGRSEDEIEARLRDLYSSVVAVLVYRKASRKRTEGGAIG